MEAAECGAAALGIILEYHGRYVPLETLRDDCRVSRDGSNALYIKLAAKKYGLEVRAFRKSADGLTHRKPPFIVFWRWNHFLVVEGFTRRGVRLNDPAVGRRSVSIDEFRHEYSGIAFTFERRPDFVQKGRRPSALVALSQRLSSSKAALALVILAGLVLVIPNIVTASFHRFFIDAILVEGHRDWLRPLLWAMGLTAGVRAVATAFQQVYLTRLELKLALGESLKFLWHVLRLPVSFFQYRYTGDIVNRAASTAKVAGLISGELATTTVGLLTLVVYVAVMLPFDPQLTTLGVAIGGLNLLTIHLTSRFRTDRKRAIEQVRARLIGGLMWAIQIIESVKAGGWETDALVRSTGDHARMINDEQALGFCDALLTALPSLLAGLTTIAVLGLGGHQVIIGSMSIGGLVAFQTLLAGFNQPFSDMARLSSDEQELRADLDRLDDVRHRPVDVVFSSPSRAPLSSWRTAAAAPATAECPRRLSGHLEFRKVSFGYNRSEEEPLIKEFCLTARPGQRIALVGSSGSGKSTIGRLAAGLYQPWSGQILYDGKPLAEISRELLVNSIALVDTEICLFEGTVRDNLTLWDDLVPSDRLDQAARDAAILREIQHRRGGYGAPVAEQARNFSGGQRQRLQIARALVRAPSLLILDEATSALDPKTEQLVDGNLRRRGCTCLIIAHRLATIRDCDEIIVLMGGIVTQRGTHEDLIRDRNGEYARLVTCEELPGLRGLGSPARRRQARSISLLLRRGLPWDHLRDEQALPVRDPEPDGARYIIEELRPYSQNEHTAANLPLPLDDPEAVWWVESGAVDVFTQLELDDAPLQRRHLCRVPEGGSIFSLSTVQGREGGRLVAVGVGPAQLLKFARGELIRLSFERGLSEQVVVLLDDWVSRVCRALAAPAVLPAPRELQIDASTELEGGTRFVIRTGVAWVRHQSGNSQFLDEISLPVNQKGGRFPLSEHVWLRAMSPSVVTAWDTKTMIEKSDPWMGLDDFHSVLLAYVREIEADETRCRWNEFQRSLEYDTTLIDSVSLRLAAAANAAAMPAPDANGDALLHASTLVGQELGIEVRSPRLNAQRSFELATDPLGDVARASGFHVRPVSLGEGWWRKSQDEPLLAHHVDPDASQSPVALLPVDKSRHWFGPGYEMVGKRGRQPVDDKLAGQIVSPAWIFYRSLPDRSLSLLDLARFCRSLRNLPRELMLVVVLAFLGAFLGLSIPIAAGLMVDQIIPAADDGRLAAVCLFLIVLAGAAAVFHVLQGLVVLRIEGRVTSTLIPAVWDRLLRLPVRFYAQFSSGDLALRAMGLSEIFRKLSGAVVTTVVTGVFSILNLALLYFYSWRLAVCATALLGVMIAVTGWLLARRLRHETEIRRIDGKISGLLLELFGGIVTLRCAGAEGRAFARWARPYAERLALTIRSRRCSNRIYQWLALCPIVISMIVYAGTVHLDPGLMKTGSFLAFIITLANLISAVLAVSYTSIGLLELLPMYQRIKPILDERPEFAAATPEPVRLGGSLALNHVSFHYPDQAQGAKVLDDVSLQVHPGEFVAIVGPSGSGKSTLVRLLLGFETPDSGTVTFDKRELTALDLREVRRQIGVVLQHAQIMPSDIFSNIVGFTPFLTKEHAWEAARLAGLDEDIRAMPMEMHTLVGEGGANLSSGQRQRLLIARAIVRRPKILLLDEATSALDNVTQAIVTRSLLNQLRDMTRVVIAHRLDVIVNADRIYVLSEGSIVQFGRYHELLGESGPFREMARRQMP
jgi:NHLM bacteriocin system ABC transporter peptidase/ATP-binding protein/NHLM bacteriocin system ABC transporter ATP-binding protein